jgi:polysaccharide export outer membrane protein
VTNLRRPAIVRRADRTICALAALLAASGCATLPHSGPTASEIVSAQRRLPDFDIRPLDQTTIDRLAAEPPISTHLDTLGGSGEVGLIGPGDILQISIYEIGASLFSARSPTPSMLDGFTPAAGTAENLPLVTVAQDGGISLPWIGRLHATGKTGETLATEIVERLRGKSQDPQVMVTLRESVSNSVMILGDVRKPGRYPLTQARERVLDAIALAGGVPSIPDSMVQLNRSDHSAEAPLGQIGAGSADDVVLLPRDRLLVQQKPRTFTILGATGKPAEIPFQNLRVSLAEAMGRSGGPNDQQADPSAVFVFRYEPAAYDGSPAPGARRVAYRLDMRAPTSYFLAQRFEMQARDVIYVANARANLPTKAIQILNLFFSPFYTAKVLTQ